MTFSDKVIEELAKYVVSVPAVTNEIVQSKKADRDQITKMISQYAGCSEDDPKIKKIALFFTLSCGETLKYMFKVAHSNLQGSPNSEICQLETEYKEILNSLTKDDFSTFVISGLDALIKINFKDKN